MQRVFMTYRNGEKDMTKRLEAALAHFRGEHGMDPEALVVHPTEADDAAAVAMMEVLTSGGCLVPEVWLQQPR